MRFFKRSSFIPSTLRPPIASSSASRACGPDDEGLASRGPSRPCTRWSTCSSTHCTSLLTTRTLSYTVASLIARLACEKAWLISSARLTGAAGWPSNRRAAALAHDHAPRARWFACFNRIRQQRPEEPLQNWPSLGEKHQLRAVLLSLYPIGLFITVEIRRSSRLFLNFYLDNITP